MEPRAFILMAAAYFLGAVPFGVVVARVLGGRDPRTAGSGNIGATNVGRLLGKKAGIATLILDLLKGFLPVYATLVLTKDVRLAALVGLFAFLGHLFPVYLKFKGGKGIATGAGVFLALSPLTLLLSVVVFALLVWRWRMVSLGSVVSSIFLPLFAFFTGEPAETVILGAAVGVLAVFKHRENIGRILSGTESRLGEKK